MGAGGSMRCCVGDGCSGAVTACDNVMYTRGSYGCSKMHDVALGTWRRLVVLGWKQTSARLDF